MSGDVWRLFWPDLIRISKKGTIMNTHYSLFAPWQIFIGAGSLDELKKIISDRGAKSVLLISDQGVTQAGLVDKPKSLITESGAALHLIDTVPPEPTAGAVEELLQKARSFQADIVVAIGGGSVLDSAKLIAALLKSGQSVKELLDGASLAEKGIGTVLIPTTSGTGSESTQNAIVTVPEKELKVGIVSPNLMADFVILDPTLTLGLPKHITAATGMDALAHAIECFISKKSNPLASMLALESMKLIFGNLLTAYNNGSDIEARQNMLLASFLGGMCIATSSTVAVHALAYPLGGKYKIAHGVSNAMLLPHVMAFNADAIEDKLYEVALVAGVETEKLSRKEAAAKVIDMMHDLSLKLSIPTDLKEYGITRDDVATMVEEASKVTRLLGNNPKELSKEDMTEIYMKLL